MPTRVLVIDDSATTAEILVQGLTAAGIDAHFATDLASLDAKLAERVYDLVLVDVNMPEMYGDDVVEFLRTQRKLEAKLILYSGLPDDELASKVQTSGADGYVSKNGGIEQAVAEVIRLGGGSPPPPAAPPAAPAKVEAAPAAQRKRRVLIVDDSEVTASIIQAELIAKGFDVHTADTADKATKIILKKQTRPDLVLLDVRMPNVNGEQFCRFIKSNSLFKGIKVLLCSGENVEELQRICREAGADGYVPKDAVLSKVLARELPDSAG